VLALGLVLTAPRGDASRIARPVVEVIDHSSGKRASRVPVSAEVRSKFADAPGQTELVPPWAAHWLVAGAAGRPGEAARPRRAAEWAGHSVAIWLKSYAKCTDRQGGFSQVGASRKPLWEPGRRRAAAS
jgi:hypothetical protein